MRLSEAALCLLCGLAILLSDYGVMPKTRRETEEKNQGNLFLCQEPRFIAARKGRKVAVHCFFESVHDNSTECNTTWYIGTPNGTFIRSVLSDAESHTKPNGFKSCSILILNNIQRKDSGVYFCKFNSHTAEHKSPCGTELMVLGYSSQESARSRNMMKDAIIMIQTILIVLFVVVPAMLLMEMKKKKSVKLEDHTYEVIRHDHPGINLILCQEEVKKGLEIYQSATYEDIQNVAVLTAKSMIGEHPCIE